MKCPHCTFDNPADAVFCQNCGRPLEQKCPNCSTLNATDARFCKNCGFGLSGASAHGTEAAHASLYKYIPKELAEELEATRTSRGVEGERRIVTVLFCDVQGSTALAGGLDPEEWSEIINGAFQYLIQPV